MSKFCTQCGTEHNDDAKFCVNCGTSFEQSTVVNNVESNNKKSIGCFICKNSMKIIERDGFLGGRFYVCEDCGIELKDMKYDNEDTFSLHDCPKNTRFDKKYKYNPMTMDDWESILNYGFSKKENEEYASYTFIASSQHNCPFCNINFSKYEKKSFLTSMTLYICDNCKLTFQKVGDKYRFMNYTRENPELWKNYEKKLTREEWNYLRKSDVQEFNPPKQDEVILPKQDDLNTISERENVKVDINRADIDELSQLPVFNLIQAKKIVQLRLTGNYVQSFDDLKNKIDISDDEIEILKDHIIITQVNNFQEARRIDI